MKAWTLSNEHIEAKVILQGGNIVSLKHKQKEYIWLNIEGATHYGAGTDAFPLARGLILHGGIRLAAVTAEHGLYFDTDWDIRFEKNEAEKSASIILSIQDSHANRDLLIDPLSKKNYCSPGSEVAMSKYPVSNATFQLKITLKSGEEFLRLSPSITTANEDADLEAWLPQTYPVNVNSQIISHQKKRRLKDYWVYDSMIKDKFVASDLLLDPEYHHNPEYTGKNGWVVGVPPTPTSWANNDLNKVLSWPAAGGGILYDYPHRDGDYHAVSFGDGRGVAYVSTSTPTKPHYTKLWSWGDPKLFNRENALKEDPPLAAGRPKAEYYEPWGSAFNTGFFEPYHFVKNRTYGWDSCIVPISAGLDSNLSQVQLRDVVDRDAAVQASIKICNP